MYHFKYTIGVIVLLFFVVTTTRALPFIFGKAMQNNQWILFLGKRLPISIILLLAVYYLISMAQPSHWHILPFQLIAIALTLCAHWKWRNTTVSLLIGTTAYLLMTFYFSAV